MMNNTNNVLPEDKKQDKKPNEVGGFYFSSFVKVTDPNTQEILVLVRGDN